MRLFLTGNRQLIDVSIKRNKYTIVEKVLITYNSVTALIWSTWIYVYIYSFFPFNIYSFFPIYIYLHAVCTCRCARVGFTVHFNQSYIVAYFVLRKVKTELS